MQKFLFYLLILFVLSCSENKVKSYERMEGMAFGTTFHITMDSGDLPIGEKQIDSLINAVNKSLSTYIPGSDISRINKGDSTVIVDELFKEIYHKSGRIWTETDGAFDPTIGIMVNAWGFGPGEAMSDITSKQVDCLMTSVGFNRLFLKRGRLVKPSPMTYLDFNANAKGLGVDVIGRYLESKEVKNYLVEIGGEIRTRGRNEKDKLWKVAIEEPNFDGSRSFQAIIELDNESIATSGNYRKFKVDSLSGEKFAHTIDTKTGYPSKSDLLSASVIGPKDCADVDGYATAFMAMGLMKSKVFLQNHKSFKAFLIYGDKDGKIKTFKTENLVLTEN